MADDAVTDKRKENSDGNGLGIPCPHCKRGIPCGAIPKKTGNDILDRIKDFQARLWEKKQKDPLSAIAESIISEIIGLRLQERGIRSRRSGDTKVPPMECSAPLVCPNCKQDIQCHVLPVGGRKNKSRRDVLDRILELKERLAEKKSKDPVYGILEDAHLEIERLRESIGSFLGKK